MKGGVVVADAGPLHYLVLINCADTLSQLFDRVLIPFAVRDELVHSGAPQQVKDWITQSRSWLEILAVTQPKTIRGLHRGEEEALQLALQVKTDGVLLDDMDARAAARRLGLAVIGTVAILERAAEEHLIDLSSAIQKIRRTNFFISPEILDAALERDRKRRSSS